MRALLLVLPLLGACAALQDVDPAAARIARKVDACADEHPLDAGDRRAG